MTQEEKIELWEKVMGLRTDNDDIENLFEEGKPCDLLWEKVFACEERIREKLGVSECKELEYITCYMDEICKLVSLRMFDYGAKFSK